MRPSLAAPHLAQHAGERAPEIVDLIEQMQRHGDALVIDAEIVAQFQDQPGPRNVDLGENQLRLGLRGRQPSLSRPSFRRPAAPAA